MAYPGGWCDITSVDVVGYDQREREDALTQAHEQRSLLAWHHRNVKFRIIVRIAEEFPVAGGEPLIYPSETAAQRT